MADCRCVAAWRALAACLWQVRVHLDDQMDAKSLLGAYMCTAVPGEFTWQPGPLARAVAQVRPPPRAPLPGGNALV